jgi:exodeoxyribonuclease V gamma subunit
VHTSDRLEELFEALATLVAAEPPPALADEIVAVPNQGLGRWLRLRFAARAGIAAGLRLPFVGAYWRELAPAAAPERDPLARDELAFRIWRVLGEPTAARDLAGAFDYCRDDPDDRRKLQLCIALARAFDDYQLYRPDFLQRWLDGDDGRDLGPHGPWQARLWRRLVAGIGWQAGNDPPADAGGRGLFPPPPAPAGSPLRLAALRRLLDDPARARAVLPPRLSVFGASTLPPAVLELLAACARHVPVHLFVLQPARLADGGVATPLLAGFGQCAREFAALLAGLEERTRVPVHRLELPELAGREPVWPAATLLAHVQQSIADLDPPTGGRPRHRLRTDDASLRVHDCHSPYRELEVVRDQILAAFAADPTLEPRDVVVQVPDIETYAPIAEAVFGPVAEHLPFHVADRQPVAELPICATAMAVLELATERVEVHEVFRVLEEPAVHRRFGLSPPELGPLRDRCEQAAIRWGIDGPSRARTCRVPPFDDNSWRTGLERLLFGIATGPVEDLVLGVLPVADATSSRDESLARFVAFTDALFALLAALQRPQTLPQWADRLDELLAALFLPQDADDEAALQRLQQAGARLRAIAAATGCVDLLAPAAFRDWLAHALGGSIGSRGFLAGAVTVAALQPLRAVPARIVFVCGLDDASFPRRPQPLAFDLLTLERRPGDPDARLDDRQLFLDLLLAARDQLHLLFVGRSQKDDSECAPSVVLLELLDQIDRTCEAPPGWQSPRQRVVVRHPLQPWSHRYRTGSDDRLFTYARAARRLPRHRTDEPPWFAAAGEAPPELLGPELPLERLLEFWRHPCRFFLQHVLRVRLRSEDDATPETEPLELSHLDRWRIQDRLLRIAERAPDPARRRALLRASGMLPVGGGGDIAWTMLDDETQRFLAAIDAVGPRAPRQLDVSHDGLRISGQVDGVAESCVLRHRLAKLKAKDQIAGFVQHVVVACARHAGGSWPERTIVQGSDGRLRLGPLDADTARAHLALLLDGYRAGLRAPLPFFPETSAGWAGKTEPEARRKAAREKWLPRVGGYGADSEDADVALCFRGRDPLELPEFAAFAEAVFGAIAACTEVES